MTFSRADYGADTQPADPIVSLVSSGPSFAAGEDYGSEIFRVWAKNRAGEELGPEAVSITVVEPTSVKMVKIKKLPHPEINPKPRHAYVGMTTKTYILPNDVSFGNVILQEGRCDAELKGYFKKFFEGREDSKHREGKPLPIKFNMYDDYHNQDSNEDTVESRIYTEPPSFEDDSSMRWDIPWFYWTKGSKRQSDKYFITIQRFTIDGEGKMTAEKGGAEDATPPYELDGF